MRFRRRAPFRSSAGWALPASWGPMGPTGPMGLGSVPSSGELCCALFCPSPAHVALRGSARLSPASPAGRPAPPSRAGRAAQGGAQMSCEPKGAHQKARGASLCAGIWTVREPCPLTAALLCPALLRCSSARLSSQHSDAPCSVPLGAGRPARPSSAEPCQPESPMEPNGLRGLGSAPDQLTSDALGSAPARRTSLCSAQPS
jgi:hypothetical protein